MCGLERAARTLTTFPAFFFFLRGRVCPGKLYNSGPSVGHTSTCQPLTSALHKTDCIHRRHHHEPLITPCLYMSVPSERERERGVREGERMVGRIMGYFSKLLERVLTEYLPQNIIIFVNYKYLNNFDL